MAEPRTDVGPPRWVYVWFVVVSLIVVAAAIFVAIRAQSATDLAKDNTRILESNKMSSQRADCRSTIAGARRDVFDQVAIQKALVDSEYFSLALKANANGQAGVAPEEIAKFSSDNDELHRLVGLAEALPADQVDRIVDRGGSIMGSTGVQHFDACPKVSG